MKLRWPLNSPAYKFGVNKSYNDVMGTVSKECKIFLLKLINFDYGRWLSLSNFFDKCFKKSLDPFSYRPWHYNDPSTHRNINSMFMNNIMTIFLLELIDCDSGRWLSLPKMFWKTFQNISEPFPSKLQYYNNPSTHQHLNLVFINNKMMYWEQY